MKSVFKLFFLLCLLIAGGWLLAGSGQPALEGPAHEKAVGRLAAAGRFSETEGLPVTFEPVSPVTVHLNEVVPGSGGAMSLEERWQQGLVDLEQESVLPPAQMAALREQAERLPLSPAVQQPAGSGKLRINLGFPSIDTNGCCNGAGSTPPDPQLAVGPNHVIAVVNVAFDIYNKSGSGAGPVTFSDLFATGLSSNISNNCTDDSFYGPFDPNVLYDEEANRFIMAVDGNGASYCMAVSATADPTGAWYLYEFPTGLDGNFFDYPHAGVGRDAIYMGANMFYQSGDYAEGRVWAFNKTALYAGDVVSYISRSTGDDDTPQPINLHGYQQNMWPQSGPHYFLSNRNYNGETFALYTWQNPFGANQFSSTVFVDLPAIHGVAVGMPIPSIQPGETYVEGNDFRPLDFEYHNGSGWTAMTVSCNPGGGAVNCIQWAQIDLEQRKVVQAGILGSPGEYRYFPDLAVNAAGDMVVGYTRSSSSRYPSVWAAGRQAGDPAGTLTAEVSLKVGETAYTSFEPNGGTLTKPYRWGDYTGMTIDPNGSTFWYLGEYSKQIVSSAKWGTYIASLSFYSIEYSEKFYLPAIVR